MVLMHFVFPPLLPGFHCELSQDIPVPRGENPPLSRGISQTKTDFFDLKKNSLKLKGLQHTCTHAVPCHPPFSNMFTCHVMSRKCYLIG
jgi:hypothetical protein